MHIDGFLSKLKMFLSWTELKDRAKGQSCGPVPRDDDAQRQMAAGGSHPGSCQGKFQVLLGPWGIMAGWGAFHLKAFTHSPQIKQKVRGCKPAGEKELINIAMTATMYKAATMHQALCR